MDLLIRLAIITIVGQLIWIVLSRTFVGLILKTLLMIVKEVVVLNYKGAKVGLKLGSKYSKKAYDFMGQKKELKNNKYQADNVASSSKVINLSDKKIKKVK